MLALFRQFWPGALIVGGIVLSRVIVTWRRAAQAATWPTVAGVLTESHLKKGKHGSSVGHGNARQTIYIPKVRYRYEIDGVHFTGTQTQFGTPRYSQVKSKAQTLVDQYAVGQAVQVHYNPRRPGQSVLETGLAPSWRTSLIFSLVMLAISAASGLVDLLAP